MPAIKPKLRQKNAFNPKLDATQRELEWLEREFHKNLKIGCDDSIEDEGLDQNINLQNELNDLSN